VHNEYGTTCHCDLTGQAFRGWLRARYGDLDRLNEAWSTAFWSQRYTGWAQIRPPNATQYLPNPAQVLDFRRFTSDELLAAYAEQRDILRAATPGVPVTTNFVLGDWVPADHSRWAREVDLVAVDHYPSDPGPGAEEQSAFAADLARGWARHSGARADWLLMETAPNLIYAGDRMHAKEPGRMARQALAAIGRGSGGAMYFQWRAPRGGAELFHSALVPHAGADSRVYREAVALGEKLARIAEVSGTVVSSRVAIAYDEPSAWALRAPGLPSTRLDHHEEARRAHRAFWRLGITTDVIGGLTDLAAYAVIVLPAHYLISLGAQSKALWSWVEAGGHLVVTFMSGIAGEDTRIHLGGHPGALRDLLGVRVEEFHPLGRDERVRICSGATGDLWSETVHLTTAKIISRYAGGVLDGRPAITRNNVGRGTAWYVSTRLDEESWGRWLGFVADAAGARPVRAGLPPGVEVVVRRDGEREWLFAMNHTAAAQDVPADGVDLLTGSTVTGSARIPAGGAAVIRVRGATAGDGRPAG
jgi:beta-galactosidase